MGNVLTSHKIPQKDPSLLRPSAPVVELSQGKQGMRNTLNRAMEHFAFSTVTEEVRLTWRKPKGYKKSAIYEYKIEMFDLATRSWVEVTRAVSSPCLLSNILSGMLYQFRVIAIIHTKDDDIIESEPSDSSEAFIVDIPNVNIAPYFVNEIPKRIESTVHDTMLIRAEALGTPKPSIHWYKDDEEIFLTEGVAILEKDIYSELKVENLQLEDAGTLKVCAINIIGKCTAEIQVGLTAKPEFLEANSPRVVFTEGEVVRVKLPVVGNPRPSLAFRHSQTTKGSSQVQVEDGVTLKHSQSDTEFVHNFILNFRFCQKRHSGTWNIIASNSLGSAELSVDLVLREPPARPGTPHVVDNPEPEIVTLEWPEPEEVTQGALERPTYHVEYYRDQWQLWLKGKMSKKNYCTFADLVPGSYYKFRVRAQNSLGLSEPSHESENIFLGLPQEDELFGLPGGNYPKLTNFSSRRPSSSLLHLNKDQSSPARSTSNMTRVPSKQRQNRQISLDREVFYVNNHTERKEVVKLVGGSSSSDGQSKNNLRDKYKMSEEDLKIYQRSLQDLCSMLHKVSSTNLRQPSSTSSVTGDDKNMHKGARTKRPASKPKFRKAQSFDVEDDVLGPDRHFPEEYNIPIQQHRSDSNLFNTTTRGGRRKFKMSSFEASQSLTDIYGRISSYQSLLKPFKCEADSEVSVAMPMNRSFRYLETEL